MNPKLDWARAWPFRLRSGRRAQHVAGLRRDRGRRIAAGLIALIGAVGLGGAQAEDRALVVGIMNYQNPADNLVGIDKDVASARAILKKLGFKDSQVKVLQDRQATRSNIISGLTTWLTQGVRSSDRVVFYFAGHGQQIADDNGDEEDGCDEGIVAYDGLIRDDIIAGAMDRVPANESLVMLDSCFSGTVTRGPTPSMGRYSRLSRAVCNEPVNDRAKSNGIEGLSTDNQQGAQAIKGVLELSAAQYNEVAAGDTRGGYFTRAVYERVVNGSAPISFNDLRDFVTQFIAKESKTPSRASLIGPEQWRQKSVFLFGQLNKAGTPSIDQPPAPVGQNVLNDFQQIMNSSKARVQFTSAQSVYALGDLIRYDIQSPISGYLNVLELNPDGSLTILFPNRFDQDNRVEFKETVSVPGPAYRIRAVEPTGKSRMLALVSKEPINLYTDSTIPLEDGFRYAVAAEDYKKMLGELGLTRSHGIVGVTLDKDAFYAAGLLDVEIRR